MSTPTDLTNREFGRLTVKARASNKDGKPAWLCKCSCGGEKTVRASSLVRKEGTKSCGCLAKEFMQKRLTTTKTSTCTVCNRKFNYVGIKNRKRCSSECRDEYRRQRGRLIRTMSLESNIREIARVIIGRAKKFGFYDITSDYVVSLAEKQNWKCAKTGVSFELKKKGKSPYGPSIDQIIPGKGYTKDNIQLVCMIYNYAKHTWEDDIVLEFAKKLVEHETD